MSDIGSVENYFSGQEVLQDDLSFDQQARINQDQFRTFDFWNDGVVKDINGLSNMLVSVDSITSTLINVSQGLAYSNGYRISINNDLAYNPNFLTQTVNGICTPASSGNKAIPLASYVSGQSNFVWAQYVRQVSTGRTAVSFADGSLHYPNQYDGYGIFVTTVNPPGNPAGITNSVYLGTVFGQGAGNNLVGAPNGLTDVSKIYASIKPVMPPVGNTGSLVIGNGVVRGSSANSGGSQQEILQGTVSTPDLRSSAVTAPKLDTTNSFTAVEFQGTTDLRTPTVIINDPTTPDLQMQVGGVTAFEVKPIAGMGHVGDMAVSAIGADAVAGINVYAGSAPAQIALFSNIPGYQGFIVYTGNVNAQNGKLQEGGIPLIPAGTQIPFYQPNVPAGWTAINLTDFFLRANSVPNGGGGTTYTQVSPGNGYNVANITFPSVAHSHGVNLTTGVESSDVVVNAGLHALIPNQNHTHTVSGSTGPAPVQPSPNPYSIVFSYANVTIGMK